jgi:ABC-type transport system involved in cytochrome c biogenesis permease subunit
MDAPPIGPVSLVALLLVVGFLVLLAYQAFRQGTSFRVPTSDFLAFFVVAAFAGTIVYMFVGNKPNEGVDIMIGALIAAFSAIIAVYFKNKGEE